MCFFLGYANEVGESFRALIPVSFVRLSYIVSFGYVCADIADKCQKTYRMKYSTNEERNRNVTLRAMDTFVWQALASVIVPGFTINRICALSFKILKMATRWSLQRQKWTTTAIGLGSIPFIVKPIDIAVERGMNALIRKYYPDDIFDIK
ncbi:unnamed protein product [Dracunculus medinensis]|uniref:Mitochondrial fission process protein 1 n=1 Tax=Dracunculus medinensis TaxID=318479 RepID=A0A0N4URZ3_DRAME|nr:unnamed protein product [Dracunculus medinensis]